MKAAFIINKDRENVDLEYEGRIAAFLNTFNDIETRIFEFDSRTLMHKVYASVKEYKPDILYTFNDSSLKFVSETGGSSLNRIPCKGVHVLTDSKYSKTFPKASIYNLSHYFMVPMDLVDDFFDNHADIPNVIGYDENNFSEMLSEILKETKLL